MEFKGYSLSYQRSDFICFMLILIYTKDYQGGLVGLYKLFNLFNKICT